MKYNNKFLPVASTEDLKKHIGFESESNGSFQEVFVCDFCPEFFTIKNGN